MFQQLSRYVYTLLPQTTSSPAAEGVETDTTPPSRLTASEPEDDWVLVDHRDDDSEGNSKSSSVESLLSVDDDDGILIVEDSPERVVVVNRNHHPVPALLSRTNASSPPPSSSTSLPCSPMETSWFLTPPPCFISQGPVHMETSPLENLLIEHPSMSVYVHHARRHEAEVEPVAEVEEEADDDEVVVMLAEAGGDDVVVVRRAAHLNRVHVLRQQQEQLRLRSNNAQKVQLMATCKSFKRGSLNRNNKAREVNSRNRRQRRGERSQGAKRSFANNNRKC
ncbi:hypothetical protein MTP99_013484 [Tenebrio molitor]|jgi:hypothetical protein|uniref:tumor protein p53-inducible nuclear protein 2 n=1 Tax=Tenebrio molitor TaxID=7067 RepID=UPI001C3B9999|nr:hypothetical protein MTP99_013484 [Tenebrio molitor]CAH1371986.1 unnamed protein product [Tenebrio molitor]